MSQPNVQKQEVLITGGAGFIGSHVAERFADEGYAVRILDDFSSGREDNCGAEWKILRGDICDRAVVDEAVEGVSVVVHLAAYTSLPESFEDWGACYRCNVGGTFNVLEACVRHDVGRLVFASSSAVYAELPDAPKHEEDCPEPISPYAVSKLEGEHLLDCYARAHGLSAAALRFFNVYGPRQPADSAYAAAVPLFAERCLRGEPVTIYGDGAQTRDFVFVRDVADAVYSAACSDQSGVYNVGTGVDIPILSLAKATADVAGSEPRQIFEPARPGDVQSSTAATERAREHLGWVSRYDLLAGLHETVAWYRGAKRLRVAAASVL